ncbi:hypothetical protein IC582_009475 [Cucumis melo]
MASTLVQEIPPPSLDATAEQPPLFDGTTRLYTAYICPYAHRAWIIRNYKVIAGSIFGCRAFILLPNCHACFIILSSLHFVTRVVGIGMKG